MTDSDTRIVRYRTGDEVTITTNHGPRTGRITAYGPDSDYVVQLNLPEHEIHPATADTESAAR